MKKILCAIAVGCVLSLSAVANAHDQAKKEESGILRASHSLPRGAGEEFRQTMRESDEENKQLDRQIAADHADLYDLLTAQDFDKRAFLKKSRELRDLQEQAKDSRDEAFASAVVQLSPKDRMTLASALENKMVPKAAHHHHKHASSTNMKNEQDQNARSGNTTDQHM